MTVNPRHLSPTFLLTLFLGLTTCSFAAAPTDLLGPGGWILSTPHPEDATLAIGPAASAVTVTVKTPVTPFYLIRITRDIPTAVPEGDQVRMHFRARSATNSPLRVSVERSGPPYDTIVNQSIALTPQWQEFTLVGASPGYGPSGISAHFQMGNQAGTMELSNITVTDLGMDPTLAKAQEALVPAAMAARIEKYRKGTLTVTVLDSRGKPVRGALVKVAQTRHAFLFGCNFFGLNPADKSPEQVAYRDQFAALFNYATLPFYWGAFEGTQGKPEYARQEAMAQYCKAHGIAPKGHPLIWHEVWPYWAPKDPDAAIPLLQARVTDLIPRYKDTIHFWDVLNEANGATGHQPPNGESEWIKRDGPAPVVETALGWARTAGQGIPETFLYNDYETGAANVALLTKLQADGKLPDAIGIQSHMHGGVWPEIKIWQVCERFAVFDKPIHFTETTVISGPQRAFSMSDPNPGWDTTPAEEAKQAAYVTRFYTILFSHPSLRAITWWDFSDKNAWLGAPAGLLRKDMSPKPAYTQLLNLIHTQWWTKTAGRTNGQGTYTARVFYGDYTVTATGSNGRTATRTISFPEAAPPQTVVVKLP
jgi:endo-1,4-beta-xylanase